MLDSNSPPITQPDLNYQHKPKKTLIPPQSKVIPSSNVTNSKVKHYDTQAFNKGILMALSFLKKQDVNNAYNCLKQLLQRGHSHADLYYLYGEVNRLKGKLSIAEQSLLKALRFELQSPYTFYSLGLVYMENKRFDKSLPLFYKFLEHVVFD